MEMVCGWEHELISNEEDWIQMNEHILYKAQKYAGSTTFIHLLWYAIY